MVFEGSHLLTTGRSRYPLGSWRGFGIIIPEKWHFFDTFSTLFRHFSWISWIFGFLTIFCHFRSYRVRGWKNQRGSEGSELEKMGKTVVYSGGQQWSQGWSQMVKKWSSRGLEGRFHTRGFEKVTDLWPFMTKQWKQWKGPLFLSFSPPGKSVKMVLIYCWIFPKVTKLNGINGGFSGVYGHKRV